MRVLAPQSKVAYLAGSAKQLEQEQEQEGVMVAGNGQDGFRAAILCAKETLSHFTLQAEPD